MFPKSPVGYKVARSVADVDVDHVRLCLERGEKHPGVFPRPGYEVEATGLMFWVSEGGGVHQTWITTLTCADSGKPYPALVVVGNMGSTASVAGGVVFEGAARGWGRGLPWEVPWQRPKGKARG